MQIGLLSDLHYDLEPSLERGWINRYEPLGLEERLAAAERIFSSERPDVVLLLGDSAEHGDREAFDRVFARMREMGLRAKPSAASDRVVSTAIATVAGNHDVGSGSSEGGVSALGESARLSNIRFLVGDSMEVSAHTLLGVGVERSAAGSSQFRGTLCTPPREGALTIVASHFPLLSHRSEITAAGLPYSGDLVNRAELETALQDARVPALVLSGHVHARCSATSGCVLQITVGAMIESPFDCTMVDVELRDGGAIVVRRRVRTLGAAAAVNPVFAPEDERWAWQGHRWALYAG
jgi:predicted phosphodiesterase